MSNKFRKPHTITYLSDATFKQRQGFTLNSFGIRILNSFNITKKQISQYRAVVVKILKALNRSNDRYYKGLYYSNTPDVALLKLNAYPYNSRTVKSQGSRMGKGKGAVEDYYYPLQAGSILIELGNIDQSTAEQCVEALKFKMPVPIRLVSLAY
jgi:ribosomal protein L16/L10AE